MASDDVINLNDENFSETIKNGIVLVDFTATWCGPCRMLAPIVDQLATQMKGKAKICKLDIDQSQVTASKYDISSVPTLILFKNGQEFKKVVGVKNLEALTELVESAY